MEGQFKEVNVNHSMADAELISCIFNSRENILEVRVNTWNCNVVIFNFSDVLSFSYELGDTITGLFTNEKNKDQLYKSLKKNFIKIPENHGYELYQFIDINDGVPLEIICGNVSFEIVYT